MRIIFLMTLFWCSSIWAQVKQESRTLVLNGHKGNVAMLELNGQTYVDLLGMARIANGSVQFQGTQVLLMLPESSSATYAGSSESERQPALNFSKDFTKAGIEAIALMREWATSLANAIQNGFPVTDNWVSGYRDKAATGLTVLSAATSTPADERALELFKKEFENVQRWSDTFVQARNSMSTANYALSPNALRDDPMSQKIISCAHSLASILEDGTLGEVHSCH
jgi:hypothetical protein